MPQEGWLRFRSRLQARLLDAAGVSSLGLVLANACAGRSATDAGARADGGSFAAGGQHPAGQGGSPVINLDPSLGGSAPQQTQPLHACLAALSTDGGAPATSDSGGAPATSGGGASGEFADNGGGGGASGEFADNGGGPSAHVEDCPPGSAAPGLFSKCTPAGNGIDVVAVNGGPFLEQGQCCYNLLVTSHFCGYVGRAFLVEGDMIKARVRQGAGWAEPLSPRVQGLSPKTRRALSEAWSRDGLFEHASVATFARFAIQLMSVGAPAHLLRETLAAGRDEIRHAELCFALASGYAGEPLEPDAFPIDAQLAIDTELTAIVLETVVEGCIGETLAALQARAQLDATTDAAVRAALEATVEDETRHAELAWKVVAWAIRQGGAPVRAAAERTFTEFRPPPAPAIDLSGVDLEQFAAHGRLTPERAREVALEAIANVVRPCAAGLFERDVFERVACSS